jgi:hypothetical protein
MEMDSPESLASLSDAHRRAEKLVRGLLEQQADLAAHPPNLPPDKLAQGQMAMANALAAAQRMLKSLDEALRIASTSSN